VAVFWGSNYPHQTKLSTKQVKFPSSEPQPKVTVNAQKALLSAQAGLGFYSDTCITSLEGASLIKKQPGFVVLVNPIMRRYNYVNEGYVEVPFGPGYLDAEFEELLLLDKTHPLKGARIIWKRTL
jgi:hypothetical protein